MASNSAVMQVVKPDNVNPETYKQNDNTYSFPFLVDYTFPMPFLDGFKGIHSTMVDGGRNASGNFEGAVIGQPKIKIDNFHWRGLSPEIGRELMQYFNNTSNFTFFARYYDMISGNIVTRRFYHGDINYEPHIVNTVMEDGILMSGTMDYFTTISMNVIEV